MFEIFRKKVLENKYFTWLQIPSNWLMQGVLHADKSEKYYKILFTVVFTVLIYLLFSLTGNNWNVINLIISFVIAHTLNWLVNCNFYVLWVHRMRWLKTSKKALFLQLEEIQDRLENLSDKTWLDYVVSHGGICRGTLSEHSDIDVSIIRKPGLKNLFKAIFFYVKEKKISDLNKVPLDIFICDSPQNAIVRSNYQKNPIVLFDPNDLVNNFYTDKLKIDIAEAKVLNNYKD